MATDFILVTKIQPNKACAFNDQGDTDLGHQGHGSKTNCKIAYLKFYWTAYLVPIYNKVFLMTKVTSIGGGSNCITSIFIDFVTHLGVALLLIYDFDLLVIKVPHGVVKYVVEITSNIRLGS